MNSLFIDTATEIGSVALFQNSKLCFHITLANNFNHLQTLHPLIEKLLRECPITIDQIERYGVDIGPGSFTGIRIGVTTARTLAQLSQREICGLCSLDILAQKAPHFSQLIVPLLDGKKNSLYTSFYLYEKNIIKRISPLMDIPIEKLIALINQYESQYREVLFLGDGQKKYQKELTKIKLLPHFTDSEYYFPQAKDFFSLCDDKKMTKDYESIKPFYLRKSEAEIKNNF